MRFSDRLWCWQFSAWRSVPDQAAQPLPLDGVAMTAAPRFLFVVEHADVHADPFLDAEAWYSPAFGTSATRRATAAVAYTLPRLA